MESATPQKSGIAARRPWVIWLLGFFLLILALSVYIYSNLPKPAKRVHLIVYAFSTQEEVFTQGIFPAFEQKWNAANEWQVTLEGVFGPAETLAGQITLGAPADIAIFSNPQQVTWLKVSKLVSQDFIPVVIGSTPLVIVTRSGNPASLVGFADLSAANGLNLMHPDPNTSGAGEWALLAEYGSAYLASGDTAAAEAQLQGIWEQVRLLAPSARAALTLFELGAGDALITYEQDALLAAARGVPLEIVYPSRTVLVQPLAVLVEENITRREREAAQAFLDFLLSAEGQKILTRYYLRPAEGLAEGFEPLVQPFTVEDLGGWPRAYNQMVEVFWRETIEPGLDFLPAPILLDSGD